MRMSRVVSGAQAKPWIEAANSIIAHFVAIISAYHTD